MAFNGSGFPDSAYFYADQPFAVYTLSLVDSKAQITGPFFRVSALNLVSSNKSTEGLLLKEKRNY